MNAPEIIPSPYRRGLLITLLVVLTALIYGRGLSRSVGEFIDAPHHLLNGIFVRDAVLDFGSAVSDPRAYAIHYYQHYPAVNIGYYPPLFSISEALIMFIVGVSGPAGQLTVLLYALLATLFAFAWFRHRFDDWWAAAATALLMFTPYLVYWGRDIMLEIPVLALFMGAIYYFEVLLRTDRPSWRHALLWVLCTVLAIWTKQHALMLLGIFAITTLTTRRFRHLTNPAILSGIALISLSAIALIVVQVRLGGDAVGHSVGFTAQHVADRFNWDQWYYYIRRFDEVIYWPVLLAALLGLISVIRHRPPQLSLLIVWPILFYLMHSYMKAQDIRYAILAMPPVIALAVYGARSLGNVSRPRDEAAPHTGITAKLAMAALLIYTGVGTCHVNVPAVSPSYAQAAEELSARMGHYSCLSFVPERAARPAVMYRMAVEKRLTPDTDIYSFGHILRAEQVLHGGTQRWPQLADVSAALIDWNVKYLLIEAPSPLIPGTGAPLIQEWLDELASREFSVIAEYPVDLSAPRWPVRISKNDHPQRTLRIYERTAPMQFNPNSNPEIRPQRVPIVISDQT